MSLSFPLSNVGVMKLPHWFGVRMKWAHTWKDPDTGEPAFLNTSWPALGWVLKDRDDFNQALSSGTQSLIPWGTLNGVSYAKLSFGKAGKGTGLGNVGPQTRETHFDWGLKCAGTSWGLWEHTVTKQPGAVDLRTSPDLRCLQQITSSGSLSFYQDLGRMSGGLSEGSAQHRTVLNG